MQGEGTAWSVGSAKMTVFWVVEACCLIEVYKRFGFSCCFSHQGDESLIALIMETARSCETLVNFL